MPSISLLATDLDGTLLYDRANITDADRNALARLRDAGVVISLATGRELDAITPALDRLDLWPFVQYIIFCSGAYLYDVAAKQTVTLGAMDPRVMIDLIDRYENCGLSIVLPMDGILYTNHATDRLRAESDLLHSPLVELEDLRSIITKPLGKIVFNGSVADIDTQLPTILNDPDPRFTAARSHENYIDCYAAGVNKGAALSHLCDLLNIPIAQAAAIGDNQNDLELLQTAGHSGCPGDGSPEAKAAAGHICCPAGEGAVADFCHRLGLI